MFKLIDVRVLPLEQIKENLNENFYEFIADEFFLNCDFETLIPTSNFIEFVESALDTVKWHEEDDNSKYKSEIKLMKSQAKDLIQQLKSLPSGVVIAAKYE